MQSAALDRRTAPITAWLVSSGLRLGLAAWLGGAITALALPPLHIWPGLLGFAVLLHLLRRTERRWMAFALGWSFGFGYFLAGLYWIAIAFFADAERFGALAFPAVTLLCAGMALYPALAAWLAMLYRWRSPTAAALALALAWVALEALRARLFGGFPWNLIGYAWSGSDAISQLGALTGIYGLSLLAVALGALPAGLLEPGGRARWWPVATGGCAARPDLDRRCRAPGRCDRGAGARREAAPGAGQRAPAGQMAAGDAQPLVQPPPRPVEPERRWRHRCDLAGIGEPLPARPGPRGARHDRAGGAARRAAADRRRARSISASIRPRPGTACWWSTTPATLRARYDKHDLVPFGEFMPLRDLLGRLGLSSLARGGLDFQAGPGRTTIALPGLPSFSPLICYEAIFPGRVYAPGRSARMAAERHQ